jgi:hypothetical protein
MRSWRRLHRSDVIAQVEPLAGFGTWTASAWQTASPEKPVREARHFELLTEAQEAADSLARTLFDHRCEDGSCGRWLGRAG